MQEKTINTRLKLKYDSYDKWTVGNPLLLKGEVAIATVELGSSEVKSFPSVIIKAGDGINTYNDLPVVSGLAADVYSWAKQAKNLHIVQMRLKDYLLILQEKLMIQTLFIKS